MTGLWIFLLCVVVILGAMLPLLKKTSIPKPKKDWRKIEDNDE